MIRYLADADFNIKILDGCLRQEPSMDFLSANAAGLRRLPDWDVLALAARDDRVLVTHDLRSMPHHFRDFLNAGATSPGVLLVRQSAPIGAVIESLILIWAGSEPEEWRNRILRIPL